MKSKIPLILSLCLLVVFAAIGTASAEPRGETLYANSETLPNCQLAGDAYATDGPGDDDDDDDDAICICHKDKKTLCGPPQSICAHLAHGDTIGECAEACGGVDGVECPDGQFCKTEEGECAEDAEGECQDLPGSCPSVYAPVCGCDGNTYSNACFADAAGVGVESEGECEAATACGGDAGDTCEMDQFCRLPEGECGDDVEGECADMPDACPDVYAPVCGCDDMTYDNACLAASAGVNVATEGACGEDAVCGGDTGNMCEEGLVCVSPPGDCDGEGMCVKPPMVCQPIIMPVCGCDGITYDNACVATAAGTSVAAPGRCDEGGDVICGGDAGDTCEDDQFCKGREGECDPAAAGICTEIPTGCDNSEMPVCGCDGMTYDNECLADAAGVSVMSQGECDGGGDTCGPAGDTCAEGQYCLTAPGECDDTDAGACKEIPTECDDRVMPVCGCDDMTYTNACMAAMAGVSVASEGMCDNGGSDACGGDTGMTCGEGQFCKGPLGECDAEGVCTDLAENCTRSADPVCGCDGRTYLNPCGADRAGVSVASEGVCPAAGARTR